MDLKDKIVEKIVAYATEEVLGKGRDMPTTPSEREELNDRIDRYQERCSIFNFIKPKDSPLYYPKQDAMVQAAGRAPVTAAVGANQIGKTSGLAAIGISWALGKNLWTGEDILGLNGKPIKPPIRVFHGGKSFTMAHTEVTMKKYNELLPFEALGIETDKQQGRSAHRIRFPEWLGGSEIKLVSYEQDPEDFEGTTWHLALWDEPMPRFAYIATKRGCMRHHAPQVMAFTPLKEPWLFEEIYNSERSVRVSSVADLKKLKKTSFCIIDFDIEDSPYLTRESKDEFASGLDEEEKQARLHGKWTHLIGRVYKGFNRTQHVLSTDEWYLKNPEWKSYTFFLCTDPHDRRPFAIGIGCITPRGEVVFIDEWPNQPFHKIKSWDNETQEYVRLFECKREELGIDRIFYWLMDPNFGRTPKAGTGRTLVEEFDEHGIYFDTRIDDEIESGHMVVREALKNGRLFFLDRCYNLPLAMENYTWDEFRAAGRSTARMPKDKPREMFKDFADVVRYVIKYQMGFIDPATVQSWMYPKGYENSGMARSR